MDPRRYACRSASSGLSTAPLSTDSLLVPSGDLEQLMRPSSDNGSQPSRYSMSPTEALKQVGRSTRAFVISRSTPQPRCRRRSEREPTPLKPARSASPCTISLIFTDGMPSGLATGSRCRPEQLFHRRALVPNGATGRRKPGAAEQRQRGRWSDARGQRFRSQLQQLAAC